MAQSEPAPPSWRCQREVGEELVVLFHLAAGDITVEIPTGLGGDFDAEVLRAERLMHHLKTSARTRGTVDPRTLSARAGAGRRAFKLTVGDGVIVIRKQIEHTNSRQHYSKRREFSAGCLLLTVCCLVTPHAIFSSHYHEHKIRQLDSAPWRPSIRVIEPFEPGPGQRIDGRRIVSYGTSSYFQHWLHR